MSGRPLPGPDEDTAFFWAATAQGRLEILRCADCRTWVHYPRPACRHCGGRTLAPETVSGRATIHSFTITHRPVPGFENPFNVILVELEEQPGLRMVSNLIEGDPAIGMPVEVTFERITDEVTLPLFRRRA